MLTERDLFIQCIPIVAGLIVECRKMSKEHYEEWKREELEKAQDNRYKEFLSKVMIVIDRMLEKEEGLHIEEV